MKNRNHFKINLIYFTAILSVAVLFVLNYFGILVNSILSSILIQCLVMAAIPMLMYTAFSSKSFKTTFKDLGFKKISTKSIGLIVLLGALLYLLNTYVATFFSGIISLLGYERLPQSSSQITNELFLQEFILSCILPGVCEEILHRGILLNCNKKTTDTRYCLIISSILFGLTHLNINQFFYAAILGYLMGYTNLVADSIYPSIIIHFMNNFLSTYFVYGPKLDWPLAKLFVKIESIIASSFYVSILSIVLFVYLIILLYRKILQLLAKERAKLTIIKIVKHLRLNNLSIEEAQASISVANKIIKTNYLTPEKNKKIKPNFIDSIFLIASIILGALITISSFIWGII